MSLLTEVRNAKHHLHHSLLEFQVAEALEGLISKVEETSNVHRITELTTESKAAGALLDETTEKWSSMSIQLEEQNKTLRSSVNSLQSSNKEMNGDLERKNQAIHALQEKEKILIQRSQSLTAAEDISLLPHSTLRRLVGFFYLSDLAHAISTCRRWKHFLDRGFLWHSFVTEKFLRHKKELETSEVQVQRQISVLLDPQKHHQLTKEKVFELALVQLQNELQKFYSIREDLLPKAAAEKVSFSLLEKQLEERRHQLGLANIEKGTLENHIAKLNEEKAQLVRVVESRERAIKDLQNQQMRVEQEANARMHELDVQIHSLEEVHTEIQRQDSGRSQSALKELKEQKKMLIKAVKALREDLKRETPVMESYVKKVAKLRPSQ